MFKSYLFSLFLLCVSACGGVGLGTGTATAPNDARPTGAALYQNNFYGMNGKTVTGFAGIYFNGNNNYIVRLDGISMPNEAGMQVHVFGTPGDKVATMSLRAVTGSQNYQVNGLATGFVFKSVYIFSTATNTYYAAATF
jgi:hypothetical protein